MPWEIVHNNLDKRIGEHYEIKSILKDKNRDYIYWIDLEKIKDSHHA